MYILNLRETGRGVISKKKKKWIADLPKATDEEWEKRIQEVLSMIPDDIEDKEVFTDHLSWQDQVDMNKHNQNKALILAIRETEDIKLTITRKEIYHG